MKTSLINLILILAGTALVCLGVFRTFVLKIDQRFWWNTIPVAVALIAVLVTCIWTGGTKYFFAGIDGTVGILSAFIVSILLLFPLIGYSSALTHHFETQIADALSGRLRLLWTFVSAFTAPGSSAYNGSVNRLAATRVNLQVLLLYFLTITPLINFNIYQFRRIGLTAMGLDWKMYGLSWAAALWTGLPFWVYARFIAKS